MLPNGIWIYTYVLTRTNKGGFTFRDGRNPVLIFGVDLSETERETIFYPYCLEVRCQKAIALNRFQDHKKLSQEAWASFLLTKSNLSITTVSLFDDNMMCN